MSQYTTGELAKQCGVTVRTVQFYDQKGILIPSALTEGGRRLYSDEDLKRMKIICFLRDTGLSLDTIGQLLKEEDPGSVISVLLEQQEQQLQEEIRERREKQDRLAELKKGLKEVSSFSIETIGDIAAVMEGKKNLGTLRRNLLFVGIPLNVLGGWLTAEMTVSSVDPALLESAAQQLGSPEAVKALTAASGAFYTVFCAFFGYLLAEKIGLMRPFRFEKAVVIRVFLIAALGGAVFSLDAWTFARWIPELKETYEAAGSFEMTVWIASVLYGGITEELMIRLFLMSGLALIGWKLFFRKEEQLPLKVLIAANILSALAFAAGHLPATELMIGELTPLLLIRCFLLNGAAGLLFGRFYRKYGIHYAMLAHMLFHLVSRTIWLIALP